MSNPLPQADLRMLGRFIIQNCVNTIIKVDAEIEYTDSVVYKASQAGFVQIRSSRLGHHLLHGEQTLESPITWSHVGLYATFHDAYEESQKIMAELVRIAKGG